MFYREKKYLVAHKILSSLESKSYTLKSDGNQILDQPIYTWINLQEIKKHTCYKIDHLRDAAWLLKNDSYIDILDNKQNIYDR